MGIFKNLFGSNTEKVEKPIIKWNALNDIQQLDTIVTNSKAKYQAIFKHSTRCGISSGVLRQFERQDDDGSIDFHYLDLLSHRPISQEIAARFGVMHQSPQLIILKNGKAIAHGSHYDIMSISLDDF